MSADAGGRVHHHAPRDCPVCGTHLSVTRLTCGECETELAGWFQACEFCGLGADDRTLLRLFLVSRGNLKDLQRQLGVSYPTARARFDELLGRLGLRADAESAGPDPEDRVAVLEALARGEIDVDEAEDWLGDDHAAD